MGHCVSLNVGSVMVILENDRGEICNFNFRTIVYFHGIFVSHLFHCRICPSICNKKYIFTLLPTKSLMMDGFWLKFI